jgi:DNA-binding MarR family transcriptional regulator
MNLSRRPHREAQADDRSWARLRVLDAIGCAGVSATPTMLGELETMRSSNLAAALRQLEADGLIVRAVDADDRRKVRVRLTEMGQSRFREHRSSRIMAR